MGFDYVGFYEFLKEMKQNLIWELFENFGKSDDVMGFSFSCIVLLRKDYRSKSGSKQIDIGELLLFQGLVFLDFYMFGIQNFQYYGFVR